MNVAATIDTLFGKSIEIAGVTVEVFGPAIIAAAVAVVGLFVLRFLLHLTIDGASAAWRGLGRVGAVIGRRWDASIDREASLRLDALMSTPIPAGMRRGVPTDTRAMRAVRPTITDTARLDILA